MALVLNDRVKESTTTTGTGTVTLGGAVQGFETFAAGIGNSNTTYYCIQLGSEFEVGLGTLASDSSTLARTTIISSSNSDSAVNFSAGTKFVFCTMPASKSLVLDASNNITIPAKLIMPDVTSGKILVGDGTSYEEVAVSGDLGLASSGAMTIQSDAVEQSMIADDAVGADQLAANAVVTASIVDDNVTQAKIADDAVGPDQLAASAVVTASIVDDNVTQAKIADDAVGADQLAASAVVTASIVDDNVTQAKIADDAVGADQLAANAVVNASVASDAAIVDTKLATISTANKVDIGALDIDGASDIGAALADADLIIVDDGANGTEKKSQMSRVKTYIADVTLTTAAQPNITSLGTLTTLTVDNIIINGTTIGHTSDTDAITIGSDGDVTLTQDLELQHDGAILSFGANDEISLTHVHDTGLLLEDSGGTPTLQLHDANESIASDGSKVIITSGGTAFNMPTADGSANHVLKTDGSGTLSFAAETATALDDISTGDAASTLATSAGNITIDAQGNDTDIILKGTDGGADTTFLTVDGSDGGKLLPNNGMDLNGKELILDADADTSITADTDDQIDFRIGGSDVMEMNPTAFSGGAIYENADDIAANYSITAGKNAMSVGPITIASGVTVTVPSGQRWVIL
jgi:hypothetical protein